MTELCLHHLSLIHQSGVTVINTSPIFSYFSQNIVIANGHDIKVFALKSGEHISTMKYHNTTVIGLQVSQKNSLQLYSCSDDGVIVRWDYTGRILKVYKLGMPVVRFYAPLAENRFFITRKLENQYKLYSVVPKTDGHKGITQILKTVLPDENSIDFSIKHQFLASVYDNMLTICFLNSKAIKRHMIGERKFTCVACHPSDAVLATGDNQGRVILWTEALYSNHPIKSIYHWHTLPVADIAFSQEGSHVYSGGGESALVKWNTFSEGRHILPRLGAPIQRIVVSEDNNFVITTHSDNVLQVIDAQRNIVQVIQGLTRSIPSYGKLLPVGLLYNAHLKTLVMNGKPGHLQFFDLKQGKLMFNLDISSRNFITQTRNQDVNNVDVQKAAMDDAGLWLVTSEYWSNNEVSPHIWLKFWEYDLEKQVFVLNTNVKYPHNDGINFILFKPGGKNSEDMPLVVTASNDGCFKLWTLNTFSSESKPSWGCEFVGNYREMIPQTAAFSEDGSILAVAFGCAATLWNMNNFTMTAVLLRKKSKNDIKQLLFGCHNASKYLICHDGISISVWDYASHSIQWTVHYGIQTLVGDPFSDNIAVFCEGQNLKIFKPHNPQPLDYILKVSDAPIIDGVFVPSSNGNGISGCFKEKSQLYFVDANQNLLTVTEPNEEEDPVQSINKEIFIQKNIPNTPFGLLQPIQAISDIKPSKVEQFNISSKKEINMTRHTSNGTWLDLTSLLKALLPSLLLKEDDENKKVKMTGKETKSEQRKGETSEESSEDEKDNILEDSGQVEQEKDSLTETLNKEEIKPIDFSFLENLEFKS